MQLVLSLLRAIWESIEYTPSAGQESDEYQLVVKDFWLDILENHAALHAITFQVQIRKCVTLIKSIRYST